VSSGCTAASKIKRRSVLKTIIEGLKADGKTVVFTNGCFDLLHVGHIRYLEAARDLGDYLVIGVNTDESVKRLKGDERPLVQEFERAEVLAALESVDYVTIFHEDTPVELISFLQPHIHVKGGDYRADDLPEAEAVQSYGGRIVIMPLTEGRSTTKLVERILDQK
jgi:D-beta-D-heptose 7-phosphate kinase/D-beta-D-heptose 1-phosphate adenosyltransferase